MRRRAGRQGDSTRLERGATLVEYALGTAVLLVAGLVAFNFLSSSADTQAKAQANCISTRPPPASCVRTPVPAPTTTTTIDPASTTTTLTPPTTDPPPSTTQPPRATVTSGAATVVSNGDGTWAVSAPITVKDPGGNPVTGAVVSARMIIEGQPFVFGCTTSAAGTCDIVVTPIPDTTAGGVLAVTSINSNPPSLPPYPFWTLAKP